MTVQSDNVAATVEVREAHRFDVAVLERYLRERVPDFAGPLTVRQFMGGQSNPTYHLSTPRAQYVLRRKPPGKLLPSAHAVDREYRVITALAGSGVPVPRTYVLCQDDAVIGTWFYVMECVPGRVLTDPRLPDETPADRATDLRSHERGAGAAAHRGLEGAGPRGLRPAGQLLRAADPPLDGPVPGVRDRANRLHGAAHRLAARAYPRRRHHHARARRLPARQHHRAPDGAAHRGGAGLGALHAGPSAGRSRLQLHALSSVRREHGRLSGRRSRRARDAHRVRVPRRLLPAHRAGRASRTGSSTWRSRCSASPPSPRASWAASSPAPRAIPARASAGPAPGRSPTPAGARSSAAALSNHSARRYPKETIMADLVRYERRGSIGVITVDNPPVNALSQGVRQGLLDALAKGIADPEARALVLIGGGRTFIAGADIREFGKPPQPPDLNSVIAQYESSPKLVVAAIHGTALGGGLETAFGCHYRCAVAERPGGLPRGEAGHPPRRGRHPAAAAAHRRGGGAATHRDRAIPFAAAKAQALGIVDEIVPGDLLEGACAFAERLVAEGKPLRKIRDMQDKVKGDDSRRLRGVPQGARAERARLLRALPLRGRGGGRRHPALRRGAAPRARALRPVHAVHPVQGADPRLLLRARGGEDPRRAQGDAGEAHQVGGGDRRRAPWAAASP